MTKTEIYVYADWVGMKDPQLIGVLTAQQAKGKKAFSFSYDSIWLKAEEKLILDPDISFFKGQQYATGNENFGMFLDSMPDTWGRILMIRQAAQVAKENKTNAPNLYDIDFLLGVADFTRMGALRFKLAVDGPFLNENKTPIPPIANIRALQNAVAIIENTKKTDSKKSLALLIAPGSSLGGARPKANVIDKEKDLWIAKFPSNADIVNKALWEYLAYLLAGKVGIQMAESKIIKIIAPHHIFLTKRFDRIKTKRIHFASAMTMTGNNEDTLKEKQASYLDIAEFIQFNSTQPQKDLHQLWRRMVFNIAISNTDDHLRNHGFILHKEGWLLSPAYDINPSIDKNGLAINIDSNDNALDIDLAKSVGTYFQLSLQEMNAIIKEINEAVKNWKPQATKIGISRVEQEEMSGAFRVLV